MNAILSQSRLKKTLLKREKKSQDMKKETWQKLDKKALIAIQFCLTDKVLMSFLWRKQHHHCGNDFKPLFEEVVGESLILKQRLFLHCVHECIPMKSHVAEISSIINDLGKIEIKIEDENQTLLYSLLSSYKSFREAIIYEGKSTIKVNEVKEHLLNKDKIDTQLMGESHHDDFGQVHYSRESNN